MLPIGVATTYSVPGRNGVAGRTSSRSSVPPATGVLLAISLMAVIVGAACQPLQPADFPARNATASPGAIPGVAQDATGGGRAGMTESAARR